MENINSKITLDITIQLFNLKFPARKKMNKFRKFLDKNEYKIEDTFFSNEIYFRNITDFETELYTEENQQSNILYLIISNHANLERQNSTIIELEHVPNTYIWKGILKRTDFKELIDFSKLKKGKRTNNTNFTSPKKNSDEGMILYFNKQTEKPFTQVNNDPDQKHMNEINPDKIQTNFIKLEFQEDYEKIDLLKIINCIKIIDVRAINLEQKINYDITKEKLENEMYIIYEKNQTEFLRILKKKSNDIKNDFTDILEILTVQVKSINENQSDETKYQALCKFLNLFFIILDFVYCLIFS